MVKDMKNKLWQDRKLWAGLNRPELPTRNVEIVIFGIPYDGGISFRSGAKDAPDELRKISYTISPTTECFESFKNLKIKDIGNIVGDSREEIFSKATDITEKLVKENTFFIMIGGDHSVTIPVQKGFDNAVDEPFGIIHIDAHFDLCEDIGGDRFSHGSTERRALDLNNIKGIDDIVFLGVRSIESGELDFFNSHNVQVVSAKEISKKGVDAAVKKIKNQLGHLKRIYLTIDIDCLDPAYAAGTGTPQFGGLTSRELLTILEGVFELPIIGMDIVEVAPCLDPSLTSLFAARKIIREVCGFISKLKAV
jgi:agmatinase